MTNSQFLDTDSLSQNQQNSEPQIFANSLSLEQGTCMIIWGQRSAGSIRKFIWI